MTRSLLLAAVVVATTATVAAAASLGGVAGGAVGSGDAPIAACDTGFTVSYTTLGGNVTAVTVGDIAAACAGGALRVTVTDAGGASIAAGGPQTLGAGASASVSVAPQPPAEDTTGVGISIVGP
ncbi:MAG TPA: hypothetical protein VNI55_06220 [Gaiellaceae bacterium]|nr:hypothetical protein [Gaiellaceae bacterium]